MRVFARLVLAPLLLLFMAASPLSAQDRSAAEASPAFRPTEIDQGLAPITPHPETLPSRPLMVASSRVHAGILWRSGGLVSTQFAFGTFDRHHRHGVAHMHRHPPGAVVITPRHRARPHDVHRGHSGRVIRRHDDVRFGTPGRIHSPAVDIGPRRFDHERLAPPHPRHPGRVIRHPIRRHDDVRFGTPGRIHSPAVDIGPRRFERERLAPSHRGVERQHFQRREDIRRGIEPHHFQRREPIRRGIERHHFQRREPIRRGIERHHFRGRSMQ